MWTMNCYVSQKTPFPSNTYKSDSLFRLFEEAYEALSVNVDSGITSVEIFSDTARGDLDVGANPMVLR